MAREVTAARLKLEETEHTDGENEDNCRNEQKNKRYCDAPHKAQDAGHSDEDIGGFDEIVGAPLRQIRWLRRKGDRSTAFRAGSVEGHGAE